MRNKLSPTSQSAQMTAYQLIEAEKNSIAFDYQRFHFNSHNIMLVDYLKRSEKSNRFRMPINLKTDNVREFADLLLLKCFLPRLLTNSKEALLCAEFLFRTVR
jgi:hypothetical protein